MEYKEERKIKIQLIEVIREWAEEVFDGVEMSPHQEAEFAEMIFNRVILPLKEK